MAFFLFQPVWYTMCAMRRNRFQLTVYLLLVLVTLTAYWQVWDHDFVHYDDQLYVTENSHIRAGLSWQGVRWAFTTIHANFWHPLTWLSYLFDYQIFGLNAGGYHLTSLVFHIANTFLLFAVLNRMTQAMWRSAFVAALFALHPLHVESVAWVSERKDVLSTFFWILTMGAYVHYVEWPKVGRYLLVLVFLTLGLMAKPMLVTLPFVLLLMDYWPLGRLEFRRGKIHPQKSRGPGYQTFRPLHLVWEKVPFFALTVVFSIVTFFTQQKGGAIAPFPIVLRVANALVSYVSYMGKMIWPAGLTVFYPHPGMQPMWQVAGACLLLVCISFLAIRAVRSRPYFAVGWLWYVGTLVPVIGLVQVGSFAMADRFTYVPLIGLFVIIAWGVPEVVGGWRYKKLVLSASAGALLLVLVICTWLQVRLWHNTFTLFKHALEVTANNGLAHNNLGFALAEQGHLNEAMDHYSRALQINPMYEDAHDNMGVALTRLGRFDEAIWHYTEALRIKPDNADANNNLGVVLAEQGRIEEAMGRYAEALRIEPEYADAHSNLGNALFQQGRLDEATIRYREALRLRPDHADAHNNLGLVLAEQGWLEDAISHYTEALRIKPDYADAHNNLGNALLYQGKLQEAINQYTKALRINPDYANAHHNLGVVLAEQGRMDEAIHHLSMAVKINPGFEQARQSLERALEQGRE
jgi:tetratricopeptide (TPR) repeat protein